MDEYLFARELGNPMGKDLRIYHTTCRLHSLKNSGQSFSKNVSTRGINSLDIEKPNCRFLLCGGANGKVFIWDLWRQASYTARYDAVTSLKGHKFGVSSIFFYPFDAGMFITTSYDATIKIWDAHTMTMTMCLDIEVPVHSAAMATNAQHALVAVASQSPVIQLLDLNSSRGVHSLVSQTGAGTLALNWSPQDEFILACGGIDGTCLIWDIRMASNCLLSLNKGNTFPDKRHRAHEGTVNGVSWSEDGATVITVGHDERLRVWNLTHGRNMLKGFEPIIRCKKQRVLNPVITPLRQANIQTGFIASDGEILGISITEGDVHTKYRATDQTVSSMVYRPDLPGIVFGSTEGQIGMLEPSHSIPKDGEIKQTSGENPEILNSIYSSLVGNYT